MEYLMDALGFEKGIAAGKITCKMVKNGEIRYCLASSVDQCQKKFRGWYVYQVTTEEYLDNRPLKESEDETSR
jgi:hypothetical protein